MVNMTSLKVQNNNTYYPTYYRCSVLCSGNISKPNLTYTQCCIEVKLINLSKSTEYNVYDVFDLNRSNRQQNMDCSIKFFIIVTNFPFFYIYLVPTKKILLNDYVALKFGQLKKILYLSTKTDIVFVVS